MKKNELPKFLKEQEIFKKAVSFVESQKKDSKVKEDFILPKYLFREKFKTEIILAAILKGVFSEENKEKIKKDFGEKVYEIIYDEKKLIEILEKSKNEKSELVREVILSSVQNPNSIILELISKIIEIKKNPKNRKLAEKLMDLHVPLAERLGLKKIKKELAGRCFKIINPKKYKEIEKFLQMSQKEREAYIKKITKKFRRELKKEIKNIKVKGREKQIYSIYEKIVKRKVPLHKQRDHFAIRIITKQEKDCYKILEYLDKNYKILGETFKDYIKNPKENGYQSIHFCIELEGKIIETQIRTIEMDEFAEEGDASHWNYKNIGGNKKFERKTAWFKEILKLKERKKNPFNELKINLFQDKIYCYTPKGKIFCLKKDSTVLDFAYKVHAEIGNHSIGAMVNKKFVSLKTVLKNGETVEIITNKFQRPRREWMKFVKTKYAKKIISKEVKKYEKIPVPKIKILKEKNKKETETPVVIPEFPNHALLFAKCCNPLPKDELIGILRSYKKALIHKKGCEKIKESKKHYVKAIWKEKYVNSIKINIEGKERRGILTDLINTISREGLKIKEANAKPIGNNRIECFFWISLETIENFENIIKRVKKIKGISKIYLD